MNINTSRMLPVQETSYLTAQNSVLYRTIMRILYNEKEMLNSQMSAEEICSRLRTCSGFDNTETEQVKSALAQLTEWENVIPMQDPRKVSTIEEYKNKQYRYSISERAVIIERMTIELENMTSESNTLSSSLLVRINDCLSQISSIISEKNMRTVNEWWKNFQADFRRLNQSYSDYLHTFYSVKGEKLMKSMDFIIYKDKFIQYLRDFIRVLQKYSEMISARIAGLSEENVNVLIGIITDSEMEIPRTGSSLPDREQIQLHIQEQWTAVRRWFVSENGKQSVCSMAMEYTNEIIRKILSDAVMLMQLQNTVISRKQDYRKYLSLFAECEDINEAHCLSAHVFGVMNEKHYRYNSDRTTDSIHSDITDIEPQVFEVKPRTRVYKPRVKTEGFSSKAFEKEAGRMLHIKRINEERAMIEKYIRNNEMNLEEISDQIVPEQVRKTVLKWLSSAGQNKKRSGITDFGRRFHIENTGRRIVLRCTDGELDMPGYIIRFEEENNG